MEDKKQFFLECYDLGILKFGEFTLKSGMVSPFYVDLRPLASKPQILKKLSYFLLNLVPGAAGDLICGVPYAALPMATAMSLDSGIPLIIKRKEAKAYGTKKLIEGIYTPGQTCLLVEDVITSGKSLLETLPEIEKEGLKVRDIVVVLDRQQGGVEVLQQQGYRVQALFTITEACRILLEAGKINQAEFERIESFVAGNAVKFEKKRRLSYAEKMQTATNPHARRLLEIAEAKKTNLIASADVVTTAELHRLAATVGPYIAALKVHADILTDFSYDATILPLIDLAAKHNFLLMEDRKFADIGSTQEMQFAHGIHQISHWADLVTAHVIGGASSLDYFHNSGVITIIGMSSAGALTSSDYRAEATKISQEHPGVIGGVSQHPLPEDLLHFTPGVHLEAKGDGKGQQYNTPSYVFGQLATDFMIVGRGIYRAEEPESAARHYQLAGWQAYEESLH